MGFFHVFFQVLSFFGCFWVSGAPTGEKRNPHPNPVLRGSSSGSSHGCKNALEPAHVGLPKTQTRTSIPKSTQGAIVKPGREGPIVPVQLRGGLRSPNMTITPAGTITICMARGAMCIDNAPDTSSMAMFRTFRCRHREKASEGFVQLPHWVPLHR
jgi:hypothetical protein